MNWVLDADIRGFFDNMSHEWTVKFIQHRVGDPRIVRLIQKWLKAGVSEEGQCTPGHRNCCALAPLTVSPGREILLHLRLVYRTAKR